MSERTYYVKCGDGCLFESMTKEQIIAAISKSTGNTPSDIDDAFITKIKEQRANDELKFWVGTQAQYNAIEQKEIIENCFYIITDDSMATDINLAIEDLQSDIKNLTNKVDTSLTGNAVTLTLTKDYEGAKLPAEHLEITPDKVSYWSNAIPFDNVGLSGEKSSSIFEFLLSDREPTVGAFIGVKMKKKCLLQISGNVCCNSSNDLDKIRGIHITKNKKSYENGAEYITLVESDAQNSKKNLQVPSFIFEVSENDVLYFTYKGNMYDIFCKCSTWVSLNVIS